MSRIVSSTPGRIRLRDQALHRLATMEEMRATLATLDGVDSIECNPEAGSLTLRYDLKRVQQHVIVPKVEAAAAAAFGALLGVRNPGAKLRGRKASQGSKPAAAFPGSRLNRYAKCGMLGSLAISLAFAGAGKKRLHVVSGSLFLVCLGTHIAIHRRRLLS